MKAVIQTKQGKPEVLEFKEIEKPIPKNDEVLIKIHAGTVTRGDVIMRKMPLVAIPVLWLFGVRRKKIPGTELAGEIVEVGKNVKRFNVGDEVFGTTTGLREGGNAQYISIKEKRKGSVLALKPTNMNFEEAAAIPVGAMTALFLLNKANIKEGQKVLIYGASGSVGTFAVQLAKHFGAEVSGICSTSNLEMIRSLGVDKAIDYTKEDFRESEQKYDVIFDAVGKISKRYAKNSLKESSIYLTVKLPTKEITEELEYIKELVEQGKLKPAIDKKYPLEEIIEAHRYVESERKRGNVVITVK